jgi:predicted ATPase
LITLIFLSPAPVRWTANSVCSSAAAAAPAAGAPAAAQVDGTAQPWAHPSFIDVVAKLQRDRLIRASFQPDEVQFHDRYALCTAALQSTSGIRFHRFLPPNWSASRERRSTRCESSSFAVLVSLRLPKRGASALRRQCVFEKTHEEMYRDFGFELVSVEPRSLVDRVSMIKAAIR